MQAYQEGFESNILPEHLEARQFEQAAISVNSARTLNDLWSEIDWQVVPDPFKITEIAQYMGLAKDRQHFYRLKMDSVLARFLRTKGFVARNGHDGADWYHRPENGEYPMPKNNLAVSQGEQRRNRAGIVYDKQSIRISSRVMATQQVDSFEDLTKH